MASDYRPVHIGPERVRRRGFTLIELMVVVVIITALASLAVPSILRQMRDRRTRQAAEEIALMYRQARLRALGRGAAVMVRYSRATGFELREAVLGTVTGSPPSCVTIPTSNCSTTQWGQGPTVASGDQLITSFNPTTGVYDGVTAQAHASDPTSGGGSATYNASNTDSLDICFTPMGRTLFRIAPANILQPMTGIPVISVSRNTGGLTRVVLVPPNGLARTDVAQ